MGHHSVAEHAVFNFDIVGISRLALEEIEKFRLVSYTEKSQRYVTLQGDFVLPEEIENSADKQLFIDTVNLQNTFYKKSFEILKAYHFDKHSERIKTKSGRHQVEGWAKEDARYILSLATQGQVGVTINARNLEQLFRRFSLSPSSEVQAIGKKIFNQVEKVAPSLILFPEPSKFETQLAKSFKQFIQEKIPQPPGNNLKPRELKPVILDYTPNADEKILASFFAIYGTIDFDEAYKIVVDMSENNKEKLFRQLFSEMEFFDAPPRQFEIPDFTFQAVISSSNYAQLKRHRIATLLSGDYHIKFANTIPESILLNGLAEEFNSIIRETNRVYLKLKANHGHAADYILTNSHCRPVIMKMNLREFYHFVRLRSDEHAQWDIRNLSHQLLLEVKKLMPYSTLLLCGKSQFSKTFEQIYQRKPRMQLNGNQVISSS